MNEPMRLSASGSPLTKQLLLAGRRERPRADAKREAIAAAVLVAPRRSWLFTIVTKPWLGWSLLGLCLVVGGIVASAICTLSTSRGSTLEADPFERSDIIALEVRPRVPESFVADVEPDAPAPAPQRAPMTAGPQSTELALPPPPPPSELDLLRGARIARG